MADYTRLCVQLAELKHRSSIRPARTDETLNSYAFLFLRTSSTITSLPLAAPAHHGQQLQTRWSPCKARSSTGHSPLGAERPVADIVGLDRLRWCARSYLSLQPANPYRHSLWGSRTRHDYSHRRGPQYASQSIALQVSPCRGRCVRPRANGRFCFWKSKRPLAQPARCYL